jgi:hypothetical protein
MDIYRVHVSLRRIDPSIWRRIELSSQTTLKQLHRILQIAEVFSINASNERLQKNRSLAVK